MQPWLGTRLDIGTYMLNDKGKSGDSKQLSKDAWLKHTLKTIGEVGVANIQIESLAKDLNVTKGSFYWHFKGRDALLNDALSYWYETATRIIGRAANRSFSDPIDRLRYFFSLAFNQRYDVPGGPVERALQEWARVSEAASKTTQRVDQERIRLIADAYIELGKSEVDARRIATMALGQIIGLNVLSRSEPREDLTDYNKAFQIMFLTSG
ncbi:MULTISPECIES: TetR/AcrR family transcriptional regulator [Sphingomonadales]|jgi:AcrR family transcriptional regulator|uniref:Transcriptional regulator, TetR family n=3 Tax=Sphingomonadales TaxID=204457 RepID=A0A239CZE2_9SPHN|nr:MULTISPECIES: TetR/AcrR family transcriptional regulator [Sphingomonadales]MAO18885.1 TetR/AcrR family transcriptional regulator [Allomuricauda sp.]MBQ94382.1 TetR/AcrR family transcriptional regulator [Actinomycetota bacterium]MCZ4263770.1 TetR/AcrR family transcriptional regulator [Erythrobacter sp. G21629-S1]RIV80031.1 TetR/AcrR family transcriptional regulator [Pelagerythrobacter aerophilus]WPZ07218.1 TetR/AcrR family transcriptional regulator [Pelagerythrobacter marinus]|tara:strand:+ start:100 stop:729 length:630 start_codon:yes stop_codon:yes gene_type:complete